MKAMWSQILYVPCGSICDQDQMELSDQHSF